MALPASLRNVSDLEARLYFALHDVISSELKLSSLCTPSPPSSSGSDSEGRAGRKSMSPQALPRPAMSPLPSPSKNPARVRASISSPRLLHRGRHSPPRCPGRRLFQSSLHLGAVGALRPVLSSTHPFPSCPGGDPVLSSLAHSSLLSPLQDHPSPPLLTVLYPRH